ncbi:RNA exonuclease 3 [Entomortierella lignicola]|nr:RNA exonuclease 3 [Entomortierella lignicola]
MFASSGLFATLPCPFLPNCSRETFCIYSHVIPKSEPKSSSTSQNLTATTTTTSPVRAVKRNIDQTTDPVDIHKERSRRLDQDVSKKLLSRNAAVTQRSSTPNHQTPISAIEAAKKRRQELDNSLHTSSKLLNNTNTKASGGAVLLARPQVTQKPVVTPSTKTLNSKTSGPPVLKIDLRAHSKPQFRQAVATQFYNEFLRIYAPLLESGSSLATQHAVDQEKAVHSKSNQGSYRGNAATVLQRLKKRAVAVDEFDVGIDGVWIDPGLKSKEDQITNQTWKNASKYIHKLEELELNGYPISIPSGSPPPLGDLQTCERCQNQFVRSEFLTDEEKSACRFHDRRTRTKTQNGSPGCLEGPHVFKEDDFLSLHGRTQFIETPKGGDSNHRRHSVVAMDCEMCYTTGGFELIRISVVDNTGKPIMDELVKPKYPVLDLNSRFSGISSIESAKYTLEQVRDKFLQLIDSSTIIIGQSLENDFKVLRLIHTCVIDTAIA